MAETTVEVDGFSVSSNHEDADAIRAVFDAPVEPETPVAASPSEKADTPPAAKADTAAEPPKVDRRTREGRLQTIQQQIDAETARKHTAKAEADAEEKRLADLRAEATRLATQRQPQAQQQPTPQQAQAHAQAEYKRFMAMPDAPKIADFTGETAYQDWQYAVSMFVSDKRYAELRQRDQHAQQVTRQQEKFTTRVQAEVAKDPTFRQKLDQTPVDMQIVPYLHAHPQGDEIMVHLVNHPEIAQRLTTLHPIAQIGQIGEIVAELRLEAKARADAASRGPARVVVSNAKPPIKPLGNSPSVSDDVDEADLPIEAFVTRGNARDRKVGAHR